MADVDFAGGKGQKKGFGNKVRSCCNSIWNPQKKELLGRTGSSWAKIGAFYLIFYSCLAGFFAIMLVGFFSTVDNRKPTMQDLYSLIKQNPGMGYRPNVDKESTLVMFNMSDVDTYKPHVDNILAFLRDNNYTDENNNLTPGGPDGDGKAVFDFGSIGSDCGINLNKLENSFGFSAGQPCILLKINRVINWVPKNFTGVQDTEAEKEANKTLKSFIPNTIQVTCEGENDADIDNLGDVEFFPNGFDYKYFPYTNAEHYRSPLVMAKFKNVKPGVVIQVWCKLWERGIKHHKNDKAGSVHFELLVDKPKVLAAPHHDGHQANEPVTQST